MEIRMELIMYLQVFLKLLCIDFLTQNRVIDKTVFQDSLLCCLKGLLHRTVHLRMVGITDFCGKIQASTLIFQ